jgi:K+-sensing histidine kinase KdpD
MPLILGYGDRGKWISKFEASLFYRVSSRAAKVTQYIAVSKSKQTKNKNNKQKNNQKTKPNQQQKNNKQKNSRRAKTFLKAVV